MVGKKELFEIIKAHDKGDEAVCLFVLLLADNTRNIV